MPVERLDPSQQLPVVSARHQNLVPTLHGHRQQRQRARAELFFLDFPDFGLGQLGFGLVFEVTAQ